MSTNSMHIGIDHDFVQATIRKARRERAETIWRLLRGEPLSGQQPTKTRPNESLPVHACAA